MEPFSPSRIQFLNRVLTTQYDDPFKVELKLISLQSSTAKVAIIILEEAFLKATVLRPVVRHNVTKFLRQLTFLRFGTPLKVDTRIYGKFQNAIMETEVREYPSMFLDIRMPSHPPAAPGFFSPFDTEMLDRKWQLQNGEIRKKYGIELVLAGLNVEESSVYIKAVFSASGQTLKPRWARMSQKISLSAYEILPPFITFSQFELRYYVSQETGDGERTPSLERVAIVEGRIGDPNPQVFEGASGSFLENNTYLDALRRYLKHIKDVKVDPVIHTVSAEAIEYSVHPDDEIQSLDVKSLLPYEFPKF